MAGEVEWASREQGRRARRRRRASSPARSSRGGRPAPARVSEDLRGRLPTLGDDVGGRDPRAAAPGGQRTRIPAVPEHPQLDRRTRAPRPGRLGTAPVRRRPRTRIATPRPASITTSTGRRSTARADRHWPRGAATKTCRADSPGPCSMCTSHAREEATTPSSWRRRRRTSSPRPACCGAFPKRTSSRSCETAGTCACRCSCAGTRISSFPQTSEGRIRMWMNAIEAGRELQRDPQLCDRVTVDSLRGAQGGPCRRDRAPLRRRLVSTRHPTFVR